MISPARARRDVIIRFAGEFFLRQHQIYRARADQKHRRQQKGEGRHHIENAAAAGIGKQRHQNQRSLRRRQSGKRTRAKAHPFPIFRKRVVASAVHRNGALLSVFAGYIFHPVILQIFAHAHRGVLPSYTHIYSLIHYTPNNMISQYAKQKFFGGHFNKKGNDFVLDGSNYLKNILISSYSYKVLHAKYIDWYINNPKHEQELTDLVLEYFIKTRENLEKNWHKKIKFTIIFYNDKNLLYKETLFAKLKAAGFNVIETDKITDTDLNSQEYLSSATLHPTEKAWDELTPLIAKKL